MKLAALALGLLLVPGPGAGAALAQAVVRPALVEIPIVPAAGGSHYISGPSFLSLPAAPSAALGASGAAPLPRLPAAASGRAAVESASAAPAASAAGAAEAALPAPAAERSTPEPRAALAAPAPAAQEPGRAGRGNEAEALEARRFFDGSASRGGDALVAASAVADAGRGALAPASARASAAPRVARARGSDARVAPGVTLPRPELRRAAAAAARGLNAAASHGLLTRARRWVARAALLAAVALADACGPAPLAPQTWTHPQGTVSVEVDAEPFSLTIKDASGRVLAESTPAHAGDNDTDPVRASAPMAITHNTEIPVPTPVQGWDTYLGVDDSWNQSTNVTSFQTDQNALIAHVATASGATVTLRIEPQGKGVRFVASVDGDPGGVNRVSLGFKMHDDPASGTVSGVAGDHFLGFGERYVGSDQRGNSMTNWVEEDGLGFGEGASPGLFNPFPNGRGQTHIPIPWFVSPRGYGLLMNGTDRTVEHLGDETPDAWRVESWRPGLDATLFADPDPTALLEDLTAVTGRPPAIADYVISPRREGGLDEAAKLRAAHIPTSVLDLDVHYFPAGGGSDSAAMQAMTAAAHKSGFKAVAYFNPFIYDTWQPVFAEAAAKGYLVKHADGTPYVVLDYPNNAGMIDFTNPDAVKWYQGWLQQALNDGWDGWMYDFGEYVPRDAVMFNGMTGEQAHNLYPVLYQKAAFDLLQQKRPGDYLIFARSGFIGTGGLTPALWGGDQATDFDTTDGLPAALTGMLNLGMSGVSQPIGSDIGGYHWIFNPNTDKETYIRWTELGAFSGDMHDETTGQGVTATSSPPRWTIWSDQETQDTYSFYASQKMRRLPYERIAVREARERGTPIMRHLYLSYPQDPKVYPITDEYMYGDSLLVAPVVARGQTSRPVYLPDSSYYDYWSGARVSGGTTVNVPASLDQIPVFAKVGAIVPLLSADVETVAPSQDGSVVSAADRANFLEVAVFAGGQTSVTLDDGTVLSQSAPTGAFAPGPPSWSSGAIPAAASEADLQTCAACAWDDPANHTWKVAVVTAGDTITAGPLTLQVSSSPSVKRYLFTVRH